MQGAMLQSFVEFGHRLLFFLSFSNSENSKNRSKRFPSNLKEIFCSKFKINVTIVAAKFQSVSTPFAISFPVSLLSMRAHGEEGINSQKPPYTLSFGTISCRLAKINARSDTAKFRGVLTSFGVS